MKRDFSKICMTFLALGFSILIGCDKDDDTRAEDINFNTEDSARAAKMDNVAEGTFNIMEQAFVENETSLRNPNATSLFPKCTQISVTVQGNSILVLVDFGNSCTLNNGNVVSGSILLDYGPLVGGAYIINYLYNDFVFNNNGVSGGGDFKYEIANQNGNPQSTLNETITVTFPNTSITGTRVGLRVSEWVEGVGSGTWQDNVYNVTGNWQTEFTNGFERRGEVIDTLVRKLSCPFLVSGSLEIEQDGSTAIIDFGNGECDNLASFFYNGEEYPFTMN
ncbi:hypothetical protein [Aequorivita echinoideorum]|uniref:Lipoprotein n=1 Tax=Aequorivita echinoideorum TaxID=1549647 RepID=A0ABS5S270_9FLAO|nr:hypothetical protein [Aequorivita echinoideorum]MBT0607286.1 hypothetical protein [Aequorivita echinoideorum]